MKPHPVLLLAMVIGVGSGAMAQDRTPVQDAKLLLIAQARAVTLGKDSASIFMDVERARRWVRRGM